MLEPREADIPALFLFFVVLPVVAYILLGKWNEASKKNARVSMLVQLAAEEAFSAETMEVVDSPQPIAAPIQNAGSHCCARCFNPAKTRCSRCKSVRYCSGKCQIIHWRQGHKQECDQWVTQKKVSTISNGESYKDSTDVNQKSSLYHSDLKNHADDFSYLDTPSSVVVDRRRINEEESLFKQEISTLEQGVRYSMEEAEDAGATHMYDSTVSTTSSSDGACRRRKFGDKSFITSEDTSEKKNKISQMPVHVSSDARNMTHQTHPSMHQSGSTFDPMSGTPASHSTRGATELSENHLKYPSDKAHHPHHVFSLAAEDSDQPSVAVTGKGEMKFKKPPYTVESSSSMKMATKLSRGPSVNGADQSSCIEREPSIPRSESSGHCNTGDGKITSTKRSSLPPKHGMDGLSVNTIKKNKALFPFEELVKFFQCEVYDVSPRGLLNCGNSCYANAVLQCLTCTKPLLVYLLRGMHSRSCCIKDWCLLCELELHVAMLRDTGGPLSPNKVLSNMSKIGCRIGGGNQEDAHEFLRLLVMSMQSICLEGLGGEKKVDPRLQDTTLIQQIFGGRLRSKVKCLRCELESERYENIMDLTLEIHGRVESLEDALSQFTAPEDLDGDNMYKCGRCSTYVTARKQLSVHEAPNILTIVLKRFQTGRYGKINKCVTFPDMLDMIPYMTGSCDSPPLYMLYAVIVHLDTLNASFSGHYISYVKDLQGTWFRIDDTEVLPVDLSQVMSEGAYMLFYSRSFPRPPRVQSCKLATHSVKPSVSKSPKSSKHDTSKKNEKVFTHDMGSEAGCSVGPESIPDISDLESNSIFKNYAKCNYAKKASFSDSGSADFLDTARSSDWSIFTSSDESSFTTESTSDSFSTVDYSDTTNRDLVSYLFNPGYIQDHSRKSSISCTKLSHCRPHTRFFSEFNEYVSDPRPLDTVYRGRTQEQLAAGSGRSCVIVDRETLR